MPKDNILYLCRRFSGRSNCCAGHDFDKTERERERERETHTHTHTNRDKPEKVTGYSFSLKTLVSDILVLWVLFTNYISSSLHTDVMAKIQVPRLYKIHSQISGA